MPPDWRLPPIPLPGWAEEDGEGPGGDWSKVSVEEWRNRAMAAAGIDPASWDPSQGFLANKENIQKVYALYAGWYLSHGELKWAGMAKLAGGTVYGGLLQIQVERGSWSSSIPFYGSIRGSYIDFVEKTFVQMQKDIFLDLAWQHQAYVEGGLPAIAASYQRGDMDKENYDAWVKIATGDESAQWEGNKTLLQREQGTVLPPGYDRIADKFGGSFLTDNISQKTTSPIPGGEPFRQLYPDGDVTKYEDRWRWIQDHMLPEYKALGTEHTRALVGQSLDDLAQRKFAPAPAH